MGFSAGGKKKKKNAHRKGKKFIENNFRRKEIRQGRVCMFYTIHHFIRARFETCTGDEGGFLFISLLLFCFANSTLSVPVPVPREAWAPFFPHPLAPSSPPLLFRGGYLHHNLCRLGTITINLPYLYSLLLCVMWRCRALRRCNMYGMGSQ